MDWVSNVSRPNEMAAAKCGRPLSTQPGHSYVACGRQQAYICSVFSMLVTPLMILCDRTFIIIGTRMSKKLTVIANVCHNWILRDGFDDVTLCLDSIP